MFVPSFNVRRPNMCIVIFKLLVSRKQLRFLIITVVDNKNGWWLVRDQSNLKESQERQETS